MEFVKRLTNLFCPFLFAGDARMMTNKGQPNYRFWNSGIPGHNIVPTDGKKQKLCRYCRANEMKSPSGWKILTRSKCETCNVPLCHDGKTERSCFRLFHEEYILKQYTTSDENISK